MVELPERRGRAGGRGSESLWQCDTFTLPRSKTALWVSTLHWDIGVKPTADASGTQWRVLAAHRALR